MSEGLGGTAIGDYLADLASDAPAPGGGGAAALCGAVGAALVCMVCRLTLKDGANGVAQKELTAMLDRAEALRARLLELGAEDARVAGGMVALVHALRDAPDAHAGPLRARVQVALQAAAGTALAILEACASVVDESAGAVRLGTPVALSDAGVAAAAAGAGADGAAMTVCANLGLIEDPLFVERTRATLDRLNTGVASQRANILAEVNSRL